MNLFQNDFFPPANIPAAGSGGEANAPLLPGTPSQKPRKEDGYRRARKGERGACYYVVLPYEMRKRISLRTKDPALADYRAAQANLLFDAGHSPEEIRRAMAGTRAPLCLPRSINSDPGIPTVGDLERAFRVFAFPSYAAPFSVDRINVAIAYLHTCGRYKQTAGDRAQFQVADDIDRGLTAEVRLQAFSIGDAIAILSWGRSSAEGRDGLRRWDSLRKGHLTLRAALSADLLDACGLVLPKDFVDFVHEPNLPQSGKPAIWLGRSYENCWRYVLEACETLVETPCLAALLAPAVIAGLSLECFAQAGPDWFDVGASMLRRPGYGPLWLPGEQLRALRTLVLQESHPNLLTHRAALRDAKDKCIESLRVEAVNSAPEIHLHPLKSIERFGQKALLLSGDYLDAQLAKALSRSGAEHLWRTYGSDPLSRPAREHLVRIIQKIVSLYA